MLLTIKVDWVCLVKSSATDDELVGRSLSLMDTSCNHERPSIVLANAREMWKRIANIREIEMSVNDHNLWRSRMMSSAITTWFGMVVTPEQLIEWSLVAYMRDKSWTFD